MRGSGPGVRRLCVAVRPSQGDPDGLVTGPLLTGLCLAIGLDRIQWERRPAGIALGVVPPGVDEPEVLADLVTGLRTALSRRNESPGRERLRLTVAAHEGITYLGEPGFVGPVVNVVCSACTHPGLAALLSARPSDDLVVALPSHLGEDLLPGTLGPTELFRTRSATWIEFRLLPNTDWPAGQLAEYRTRSWSGFLTYTYKGSMTKEMHSPRVVFLGKTGAGKSSLINALFGLDFATGRSAAVTMTVQRAKAVIDGLMVEVVDTPGFAESRETESGYRDLYRSLLPSADHVVWAVQSHPRVFRPDQEALIGLADDLRPAIRLTVALTHADSIGPGDWESEPGRPGPGQLLALAEQVDNVLAKLSPYRPVLAREDVVPCSPTACYGLDALVGRIVAALSETPARE